MTAQSKLRGQKGNAASAFCPFALVESFLVAKVSMRERRSRGDIDSDARLGRSLMLTFATKKLSTGANGQKAEAEFPFCPSSFDRAVMVFSGNNLRLATREIRVRTLPWAT